jgi:hypothetical protein
MGKAAIEQANPEIDMQALWFPNGKYRVRISALIASNPLHSSALPETHHHAPGNGDQKHRIAGLNTAVEVILWNPPHECDPVFAGGRHPARTGKKLERARRQPRTRTDRSNPA